MPGLSNRGQSQPSSITLALALIKPERFEWALQKATELGVDRIVPIISQRTDGRLAEKLEKKYERGKASYQCL